MALKPFHLLSLILIISLAVKGHTHTLGGESPNFDFIKQLQGCHKGNKSQGIHQLKLYFKEFGYLPESKTHSDYFDSDLEAAVKIYQQNFHLKPSGTLDSTTVSTLVTPRCGVPDIINGTNYMHPHRKTLAFVSHYAFFDGNPKWSKRQLTFKFMPGFPIEAMQPVRNAFGKWTGATTQYFTFSEVSTSQDSDLTVGFYQGDHGDGYPFQGRNGILAHAFAPTNGMFHYNADEVWSVGPRQNYNDYETVAVHEIGHLLGLDHSQVPEAIMFPTIASGSVKNIQSDDIQGIRALYNF